MNILTHLIFPNAEKIVWVTSIEGLDETRGSANHRDGTPLTITVSGWRLPPLEYPAHIKYVSQCAYVATINKTIKRRISRNKSVARAQSKLLINVPKSHNTTPPPPPLFSLSLNITKGLFTCYSLQWVTEFWPPDNITKQPTPNVHQTTQF